LRRRLEATNARAVRRVSGSVRLDQGGVEGLVRLSREREPGCALEGEDRLSKLGVFVLLLGHVVAEVGEA